MNKKQEEELLDTMAFIKNKVVEVDERLTQVDERLTKVDERLTAFQSETNMRFTGIMERLDHELEKRGQLETRVGKLETKVFER